MDKAIDLVKSRYAADETDEFLKPIVFSDESRIKGIKNSLINALILNFYLDGDTLVFFNYRADRTT